ncbi:MAG: ABC transporter permease [Planctomycetia bacterium]
MSEPRVHARLADILREGLRHVRRRPLRSALTALTSAVAIAVTVNVISLSYGLDEDVRRDVSRFGTLVVDVGRVPILAPGRERPPFGPAELERVERALEGLPVEVIARRQAGGTVRAAGAAVEPERVQVLSARGNYLATLSVEPVAGRWLRADERGQDVAVLDLALAQRLAPGGDGRALVGRRIELGLPSGLRTLEVVGVLGDPLTYREIFDSFDEGKGARTLTSSLLSFRNVYLPDGALGEGELSGISAVFRDGASLDEGARRLGSIWPRLDMDPANMLKAPIAVFVRRDWMAEMSASSAQGALLGNVVWIIIVLVAAVMLSTLHLITIRERYDELAVRRCEGARRVDIAWQVTAEGTLLSLVGGLAGLPLGQAAAAVLGRIVGFPFRFELRFALVATLVSVGLGLLASVVPARRAAGLDPARILTRRLS